LELLGQQTGATAAREVEERARRRADLSRLPFDRFYGSSLWRNLRDAVLRDEPLCRTCRAEARTVVATVVDHVIPIMVAWPRRLDPTNLQPLCRTCHDRKTAADVRLYPDARRPR